ncbi:hypothetical protein [Microvirga sp. VF16]|uniref:hypothetical protein n=1 Tax=Microvirga sp. VF16 TaxID=2807101 RepID=UPI00193D8D51|nr:hypothetical protein [Microvirga sp. VF16]QRM35004.1 hypothetical protein JO965_42855 [Microvirga sp. VF16]
MIDLTARPPQLDFFADNESVPVLAALGLGVDSVAMLVELVERGERVDAALFADTGSERPQTYAYLPIFKEWLEKRGVPLIVVKYEPKNFKNYPPYRTLESNCLTNGTLPSKAFGFGSCSSKWKIQPQELWADRWEPARRCWAAGGKVIKLIGYDCSPADQKRYADRAGQDDPKYSYRYPLRELGWKREDCIARIKAAGLPVPVKSACFFCPVSKPHELHDLEKPLLRRIVLMEARAKPRLRDIDGLWRKPVKGLRGATPRPGSMTEYIVEKELLPIEEVEMIVERAPQHLMSFQEAVADIDISQRPELQRWIELFDMTNGSLMQTPNTPNLYSEMVANDEDSPLASQAA